MDIPDTTPEALIDEFNLWITERRPEGATVFEATLLMMNLFARMRAALTLPELHTGVHRMLLQVEERLHDDEGLLNNEGERVPAVLAEQWRNMEGGSDIVKWLANPQVPDTVPEGWDV